MGLGPNAYQSASTRSRRPSTSEAENPYQRARRLSTSVPPDGPTGGDYTRQRTISGNYGGAPTTPASRVGAFYPDRERALGRGEYDAPGHGRSPSGGFPMPGTLPAASYVAPDGSGRVMGGGMIVQQGGPGSGFLPAGNHSVATASPDGRQAPPVSFYREPSRSVVRHVTYVLVLLLFIDPLSPAALSALRPVLHSLGSLGLPKVQSTTPCATRAL